MKKVLIFSLNYYPRFIGGAEVAIKEITDRIQDVEFHVLTLRFDSELQKFESTGNVMVHRFGLATRAPSIADLSRWPLKFNKYWYQLCAAAVASQLHKKHNYDAVWGMMAHSTGIPAGVFKKKHPHVKYLLTLQEGDPPEYIERLMKPVYKKFKAGFTRADELQAISTFLLSWGKRMGFTGTGRVIPNGVDTKAFAKEFTDAELNQKKTELGKKEGDVYLVTTSRLVPKNAIDEVIRALPQLPDQVTFLVYGIGPEEEALKKLATECGVAERVRFMGQLSHPDMPLTLAASDIFIRPSRSEGMGNSFIEAMAAGLPIIATQEGGIADFLFDEKRNPDKEPTGWAVDVDSPEQISEAVKMILDDKGKVAKVTARARQMVLDRYDWNRIASEMKSLLDRLT